MMPLLTATNIRKAYKRAGQADTEVLRGASIAVNAGEVVALVGPSGAGKSTLLHILATLDAPDTGMVRYEVDGHSVDTSGLSGGALAGLRTRHIGMIFQFHHLLPEFTALENVAMPSLVRGDQRADAMRRAAELLERVGMSHRADHAPTEMSGGEQQRIAIARALMNRPAIIFADEPTGNLDSENAAQVADLLFEMRADHGIACVIATHSDVLAARASRVVRMVDGLCSEEVA